MSATGEGRRWRRYRRLLDDESRENHAEASTENASGSFLQWVAITFSIISWYSLDLSTSLCNA